MTLSARNWAWDVNALTINGVRRSVLPAEKLVLLCIAEHENADEGCAWPSQKRIAERTKLSERTVLTHIATLTTVGAIEKRRHRSARGRWDRNVYFLNVPPKYRDSDPEWMAKRG